MSKWLIDGKPVADKIDNMINSVIDTKRDVANGLLMANQEICKACIENGVEAIPIEWLRMWFTKKGSLIGIVLMGEIESDWEKENEL